MLLVSGLSPGPPLTMPCWMCPSFNSLGRCPPTSESSGTTHSEDTSSPSCGPSYTDLQLISAEEQMSGPASGADSTGKMEHQARGLGKSLLVTCCHSQGLCSHLCLKNEFKHSHPVEKLESWGIQNCFGKKTHTQIGWLVGRWLILRNCLTVYVNVLFSDESVQVLLFSVNFISSWMTELYVICTRLNLSSYHPHVFPLQQERGRFKQRKSKCHVKWNEGQDSVPMSRVQIILQFCLFCCAWTELYIGL